MQWSLTESGNIILIFPDDLLSHSYKCHIELIYIITNYFILISLIQINFIYLTTLSTHFNSRLYRRRGRDRQRIRRTITPLSYEFKSFKTKCPNLKQRLFTFIIRSQCSTTGVTKAVVCAILFVGWCI